MNLRSVTLRPLLGLVLALCCGLAGGAPASRSGAVVTLNLKDADISTLIATVSEVTGKNFVVDPRVKGKVTVVSSSPMEADAVYATFLSVLEVNGFAAIPAGDTIKIVPEANARTEGGSYFEQGGLAGDDIVTKVFDIKNGSASQLVAILRPLVAQSGHLAAYTSSNSLIVSDRAANVERLERIIDQIDQSGDREVELIHLDNAVADDVVKVLTTLAQQARQADPGAVQTTVIADPRSNSVLIGGDRAEREKMIALIKQLDQPSKNLGDTQVIYLKYADATNLAPILEGYAQQVSKPSSGGSKSMFGSSSSSSSVSTASTPPPTATPTSYGGGGAGSNPDLRVLADKDTNSLVITAPPKIMQQVRRVIAQLDIRRAQVLVEAIIAEVSANKSSDLGIDWIAYDPSRIAAAGILNSSTATALSNLGTLASGIGTTGTTSSSGLSSLSGSNAITAAASLIGTGGTALVGTRGSNGNIFGGLIKALASDADTNILSTPSLVTLDNQEAKIEVGQTVPELTGSYANSGVTNSSGIVNPFQTINNQDIGLKLGLTPTIGEGNTIRLKIEFENSTIASGTAGTATLITNKRTVSNTVSIEGDQVLVIGGLIDDQVDDSVNRIPLLSDIPLLGNLFKARSISRTKRNLMIFIHPVILRERTEGDYYTQRKYEETRHAELRASNGPVPLVGGQPPVLYHYDDYLKRSNMPASAKEPVPPPAPGGTVPELPPGAAGPAAVPPAAEPPALPPGAVAPELPPGAAAPPAPPAAYQPPPQDLALPEVPGRPHVPVVVIQPHYATPADTTAPPH
ncbi:MAG: type II secretion system secretin GspD [Nevskia sp.]|nr:type II secretion system secretin GspD [Nevskia sp.]